jgi:hypothetical protein
VALVDWSADRLTPFAPVHHWAGPGTDTCVSGEPHRSRHGPLTGSPPTQPPAGDGVDVSVSHAAIAQAMTASNSARVAPSRA